MRRTYHLIALLIVITFISFDASAQCKGFAKKMCKPELTPYIHDGNYHAALLLEGEEADLYKTFYSGQEYRLAVCGGAELPDIEFKVYDAAKNLLYDNTKDNNSRVWDFKMQSSQQLKIEIKVPVSPKPAEEPMEGCVSIMFGFKDTGE
ncbi:MAG: hypothetical protein JW801_10350 [Bacteroidales bacterium]|nr:hypothetical protein [Bacteroidales bacterium]